MLNLVLGVLSGYVQHAFIEWHSLGEGGSRTPPSMVKDLMPEIHRCRRCLEIFHWKPTLASLPPSSERKDHGCIQNC